MNELSHHHHDYSTDRALLSDDEDFPKHLNGRIEKITNQWAGTISNGNLLTEVDARALVGMIQSELLSKYEFPKPVHGGAPLMEAESKLLSNTLYNVVKSLNRKLTFEEEYTLSEALQTIF